jgi:hypothetical protein
LPHTSAHAIFASTLPLEWDVVRAGKRVLGGNAVPTDLSRGWISRLYGSLEPALSFRLSTRSILPLRLVSIFQFGATFPAQIADDLHLVRTRDISLRLSPRGIWPLTANVV